MKTLIVLIVLFLTGCGSNDSFVAYPSDSACRANPNLNNYCKARTYKP